MICPNCGSNVNDGNQFCAKCGAPMATRPTQQSPAFPQQDAAQPAYAAQPPASQASQQPSAPVDHRSPSSQYASGVVGSRRRRGAGKVIVGSVATVLVLGALGFGTWCVLDQQRATNERIDELAERVDALAQSQSLSSAQAPAQDTTADAAQESQNQSQSSSSSSSSTSEQSSVTGLEGTWKGEVIEVRNRAFSREAKCYGAQGNPLELTIGPVDSLGKFHGSLKVLYHGHKAYDLKGDVDKDNSDKMITFDDFVATATDKGFDLDLLVPGTDNHMQVKVRVEETSSASQILDVEVECNQWLDTYKVTKS